MSSMHPDKNISIEGFPSSLGDRLTSLYRSRFHMHAQKLMSEGGLAELDITIKTSLNAGRSPERVVDKSRQSGEALGPVNDEISVEQRARQYISQKPLYEFDFLVVPQDVLDNLILAVSFVELEAKVFDEWGLRRIEPFPRTALNFHGEPGTGKTLAAHSVASYIKAPIMVASYAQIESKYHGEGPKNVDALFFAAERDGAVLFIDEADSLLSKRLTSVTQGSEQAINSMRSQLLISLEKFKGVVVFSTNLVENYDRAFETRVRSVYFPMPDEDCRRKIWAMHLGDGSKPPLRGVDVQVLAKVEDVCGRDIKSALIDAAMGAAREKDYIEQQDLLDAMSRVKASRIKRDSSPLPMSADESTSERILAAIEAQGISAGDTVPQN